MSEPTGLKGLIHIFIGLIITIVIFVVFLN
jgi:hypothetical protein